MQKIKAPNDAYTMVRTRSLKIMAKIDKKIKTITATKRTPPMVVKSHFVWNAKMTKETVTTTVMPTKNIR